MNSILFQPFHLHDLTLPNRIVLSPMTRARDDSAYVVGADFLIDGGVTAISGVGA